MDPLRNVLFYRRRNMDVLCRCCDGVEAIQFKVEAVPEDEPLLPLRRRMRHHRHWNQRVPHHDRESTRWELRDEQRGLLQQRLPMRDVASTIDAGGLVLVGGCSNWLSGRSSDHDSNQSVPQYCHLYLLHCRHGTTDDEHFQSYLSVLVVWFHLDFRVPAI